jgi:biotin transport system substrate-specific component
MSHANVLPYNKEFISSKKAVAAIGVTFFVLATALSAYVRIPVPGSPVPITLQTFFVLLAGAVLGRKLGAASQIGYVILGAVGLPIFQGAGYGIAYLFGPTGGYLMGFAAAAYADIFPARPSQG